MRRDIEDRFAENLSRVRGLVTTYTGLAGTGPGRATVAHTDVLRAAVVLLHAAMEDLLRSVSRWRLPTATPRAFKDVPFPGGDAIKQTLEDLWRYRGRTIDQLFDDAIEQLLSRWTYNNSKDVGTALARAGIVSKPILDKFGAQIDSITSRRHWIVHRADVNPIAGSGHHVATSLSVSTVTAWVATVEAFGKSVLDQC